MRRYQLQPAIVGTSIDGVPGRWVRDNQVMHVAVEHYARRVGDRFWTRFHQKNPNIISRKSRSKALQKRILARSTLASY